MRLIKLISTKCRKVYHGTTEAILFDPSDPCYMHWYRIDVKLFGVKWITLHDYQVLFYLNGETKKE